MKNEIPNDIYVIARLPIPEWHDQAVRVYGVNAIAPCIHTQSNNNLQKVLIIEKE